MEYKDFFSPSTLAKLNKQSAENLKQMLGDKNLMQTIMSSQQLLGQIAKAEAPYKDKLEKLAIDIVKELYPIIDEEGITIDAKIVSMSDVNKSLDEIKINKPINYQKIWDETYKEATNKINRSGTPDINAWDRDLLNIRKKLFKEKTGKDWSGLDEIKINLPIHSGLKIGEKYSLNFWNKENTEWSPQVFIFKGTRKPNERELKLSPDIKFYYVFQNGENSVSFPSTKNWKFWKQEKITESISPESRRRIINAITQGAAVRGAFAFYLFKEHLDKIDPSLVDKYNEIMKNTFGAYDDENIIAMFLAMLAQGHKVAGAVGGSSKVIINEIKINKPNLINYKSQKWDEACEIALDRVAEWDEEGELENEDEVFELAKEIYFGEHDVNEVKINKPVPKFPLFIKNEKEYKIYKHIFEKYNWWINPFKGRFKDDTQKHGIWVYPYVDQNSNKKLTWCFGSDKPTIEKDLENITENKDISNITIQARAINFPMLVHEIVKGLFELISLQGFKGSKEQNQQIVDKVDILKNEPYDLKYGKFIYDALRNIAINNNAQPRTILYFFAEVYKMDDEEFIEFVENSILGKLTPEQERWVKITIKDIENDLKADSTGLDEIKIKTDKTPEDIIYLLNKNPKNISRILGMFNIDILHIHSPSSYEDLSPNELNELYYLIWKQLEK